MKPSAQNSVLRLWIELTTSAQDTVLRLQIELTKSAQNTVLRESVSYTYGKVKLTWFEEIHCFEVADRADVV
ncbi:chlorohydrolase [Streptococcus pneumoniae]|nr:chlorohydrolase [Streptococcus pneumoniae]